MTMSVIMHYLKRGEMHLMSTIMRIKVRQGNVGYWNRIPSSIGVKALISANIVLFITIQQLACYIINR